MSFKLKFNIFALSLEELKGKIFTVKSNLLCYSIIQYYIKILQQDREVYHCGLWFFIYHLWRMQQALIISCINSLHIINFQGSLHHCNWCTTISIYFYDTFLWGGIYHQHQKIKKIYSLYKIQVMSNLNVSRVIIF